MFDLNSIKKTKRARAPKIVIAGPGKIGKTTFAAQAPNAVGILTEDGADAVDASAFPLCGSLGDVYQAISTLLNEDHQFQSVFLDSLDWLEPLLHAHVCQQNNWKSIEAPGYGKGYIAAADEWRNLLSGFDALRDHRNMAVILIAHDKIKHYESPLNEGYDTFTLKLHDRATGLIQEWADVIGFAGYKVLTKSQDVGFGQKETKAITTGERLLYVEPHPAHCGGNRFGLKNMPLSWDAFSAALAEVTK
ncbi:MAG: ATP-binding protein [Betaproteobacteria bacterium]|nr:ATP-binding protein [Betaproteobacteria bacterium]